MNNFFSLKVTRQGLADAYLIPSVILSVGVWLELFDVLSGQGWFDTMALSFLIFNRMDDEWLSKSPWYRVIWWVILAAAAFNYGTYFLAAKFL